jgi:hypothetical protein
MELPINFEYFEKKTSIVDKLIKEQGEDVCRQIIDKNFINLQKKSYDFGFIHKNYIAQIGQKKINKTPEYLYSFILCNLYPDFEEIDITLICSRPNTKDGKQLLELVFQKGRELKYKYLSLLSIGEIKLVNWYKTQGFVVISEKPLPNGEIKAYYMRKLL